LDAPAADVIAAAESLKADPQLPGDLAVQISSLVGARANTRGDIYMIEQAIGALQGGDAAKEATP